MVDFHTHILPHIDDGAKDTEMAKAMLQSEVKDGVTDILLTPHYYGKKHSPDRFIEKRNGMWLHLQSHTPENLNVHLGAEVHFTGVNVPDYEELCKLAIGDTNYILLEFPFTTKWTKSLLDVVADFIYETGYTPIIAHVERYNEVLKRPAYAKELIEMGCLLQVNSTAFITKKERAFAFALLGKGMVHCVGTDTHDMSIRKPNLAHVKTAVEEAGYAKEWAEVQSNMQKILKGEPVEVRVPSKIKRFFGKYI